MSQIIINICDRCGKTMPTDAAFGSWAWTRDMKDLVCVQCDPATVDKLVAETQSIEEHRRGLIARTGYEDMGFWEAIERALDERDAAQVQAKALAEALRDWVVEDNDESRRLSAVDAGVAAAPWFVQLSQPLRRQIQAALAAYDAAHLNEVRRE